MHRFYRLHGCGAFFALQAFLGVCVAGTAEGGSAADAADAAEEEVLSYRDALARYRPQVWAPLQITAKDR